MMYHDPKLQALKDILLAHQPGIIGVSGGVDSAFLAAMASFWTLDYQAVFLAGPHISPEDRKNAQKLVQELGLCFTIREFSPLDIPEAAKNSLERCYYCKTALIRALQATGNTGAEQVLEGSHLSDSKDYRPGRRALQEQGVISPLIQAQIVKEDIRRFARDLGLEQADQPSRPCLMTRFAYGYKMTEYELHQVGKAEDSLRRIGLDLFRIRILHPEHIVLHIHQSSKQAAMGKGGKITECMKHAGFPRFSLQFVQRLSGYFDRENAVTT
jgi:uncharacterized protein